MSDMTRETVLRTTALFGEEGGPQFPAGPRTTLVVTRAVLEDVIGGRRKLEVHGFRKERPPSYAGWHHPGSEPMTRNILPDRHCPPELIPMLHEMERAK